MTLRHQKGLRCDLVPHTWVLVKTADISAYSHCLLGPVQSSNTVFYAPGMVRPTDFLLTNNKTGKSIGGSSEAS